MSPGRDGPPDPLTMYLVVRKDAALGLGQAMELAGAGAVRCSDALRADPEIGGRFAAWDRRPRKVALRASADELDELRARLPGALVDGTLLCLAPMRKSDRPPLLEALRPFTDAPRPKEEPDPRPGALVYCIRPGVIKTMGKAMAQAGHAALMAVERHGDALAEWRAAGMPGRVREVGDDDWQALKARPEAVVVSDAGLTQVEAGTETVVALPPFARL